MGSTSTTERFKGKLAAACALEGIDKDRVVASNCDSEAVYVAYRSRDGTVVALVVLVSKSKRDGYVETTTKAMDEGMGPYYFGASEKVLAALDPPRSDEAAAWRSRCNQRRALLAKFVPGAKVTAAMDITGRGQLLAPAYSTLVVASATPSAVVVRSPHSGLIRLTRAQLLTYLVSAE